MMPLMAPVERVFAGGEGFTAAVDAVACDAVADVVAMDDGVAVSDCGIVDGDSVCASVSAGNGWSDLGSPAVQGVMTYSSAAARSSWTASGGGGAGMAEARARADEFVAHIGRHASPPRCACAPVPHEANGLPGARSNPRSAASASPTPPARVACRTCPVSQDTQLPSALD